MGGSPTISGGMTQAEYMAILEDNRVHQAEQEELARQRALEDEARRREQEQIDAEAARAEELQSLADLEAAELELLGEVESQQQKSVELAPDFYSNLVLGGPNTSTTSKRPE